METLRHHVTRFLQDKTNAGFAPSGAGCSTGHWRKRGSKGFAFTTCDTAMQLFLQLFSSMRVNPWPCIRDQLGHHSIKVTVDIYGHLAREGNKAAVDRLDDYTTTTPLQPSATAKQKGVNHHG
jgi:hypothetical protein